MLPVPTDPAPIIALKLRLENLRVFIDSSRYPLYRERTEQELASVWRAWDALGTKEAA